MSRPLQFNRPVEYDPSLASSGPSGPKYRSKADQMKSELGLGDSDDENGDKNQSGGSDDEDSGNNNKKKKGKSSKKTKGGGSDSEGDSDNEDGGGGGGKRGGGSTADKGGESDGEKYGADEMEKLIEQLQESNEAKMRAEQERMKAEERFDELKRVSAHAQKILVDKFNLQIKRLQSQIGEMKQQLEDDDDMIETLKEQNLLLKNQKDGKINNEEDDEEVTNKLKEFHDIRELQRENIALKYKAEELTTTNKQLKDENDELSKENTSLKKKVTETTGSGGIEELKKKIDQLETEKGMFREEIKKRHLETSKLVAKIKKLQAGAGGDVDGMGDPLKEIDDLSNNNNNLSSSSSSSSAANNAAISAAAAAASAAAVAAAAEKELELQKKIKSLEDQLKTARSSSSPAVAAAPVSVAPAANMVPVEEKEKLEEMLRKMDTLMKRREEEMKIVKDKAKEKLTTASAAIKKLKTEYANLRTAYNKMKLEGTQTEMFWREKLIESVRKRKKILGEMKGKLSDLKEEMNELRPQLSIVTDMKDVLKSELEKAFKQWENRGKSEIKHLKDAYQKELKLRKQLFNQLQELKGNIRVYCRVRPMLDKENGERKDMTPTVSFPSDEELIILNPDKKTQHNFSFEKIFQPASTQIQVFDEIQDLIGSVLDGYNVCIFAYGQTGTGKTHTMEGYRDDPGVNIRALQRLFEGAQERRDDFDFSFEITLLEIYNERIQDLLGESGGKILKPKTGQYGMEVPDLSRCKVASKDQVLAALKRGSKNRHVQATNMNDTSSRSHLILSVYVLGKSRLLGREVMGKLHLIDLAGSERVGRSGATGETLKEAQHINQSLSALGNVIHARASKNAHVPYRDSTLTHLLQDSLDKNSKTLMFVQISPSPFDATESVQSLRFASRVKEVELGKAEANVASSSKSESSGKTSSKK